MNPKTLKMLSNILFYSSVVFAVGILVITYVDREKLPAGVCPIQDNQNWLIMAIGLLVLTTIVSSIVELKLKKQEIREEVKKEIEEVENEEEVKNEDDDFDDYDEEVDGDHDDEEVDDDDDDIDD